MQCKGDDGADKSALKIAKYNSVLKTWEENTEITIGDRIAFGIILQKNQIYILGGSIDGVVSKSVSTHRKSPWKFT